MPVGLLAGRGGFLEEVAQELDSKDKWNNPTRTLEGRPGALGKEGERGGAMGGGILAPEAVWTGVTVGATVGGLK